jgi:hypothetical protein
VALIAIAVVAFLLIVFDIWIGFSKGSSQTISWQLYTASQSYPVIAFALGVLMGHLFWVQHGG